MELGEEGKGDERCRHWSVWLCPEFQNNGLSKETISLKRLSVRLFFILVYVPKLIRVFIYLDDGYRRVNMLLNIACNLR